MPNLEWDAVQTIVSPYQPLDFNEPTFVLDSGNVALFQVKPDGYQIVPAKLRVVGDSVSQADGSTLQEPYIDGLVATLHVEYWVLANGDPSASDPACAADLRVMHQTLMGVLNSLRVWSTDPDSLQQYQWVPTGSLVPPRMLTNVLLASWPVPAIQEGRSGTGVTFSLATPLPYAIDNPAAISIADGASAVITNGGNAAFDPTAAVAGPTSGFTITDEATGQTVTYDSSRPGAIAIGGGSTANIDFFKGSVYLDDDPTQDLVAGLDPAGTEFFRIQPGGDQTISITGADMVLGVADAWV